MTAAASFGEVHVGRTALESPRMTHKRTQRCVANQPATVRSYSTPQGQSNA
jgi:hypothetical protein